MPGKRLKRNPKIISQVLSLQAAGLPYKEIAKETGISRATAWVIANDEDNKKLVEEYKHGFYYSFLSLAIENWESFLRLPLTKDNLPIIYKATERTLEGATILANREGNSYITTIYNQQTNIALSPVAGNIVGRYMSMIPTQSIAVPDPVPESALDDALVDKQ